MNNIQENKQPFEASNFDGFEKYKKTTSLIQAIQRPCMCIASFCLSFLLFSFIIFRIKLPTVVLIILLALGLLCLFAVVATGHIEKKLFRQHLATLSLKTQKAIKDSKE